MSHRRISEKMASELLSASAVLSIIMEFENPGAESPEVVQYWKKVSAKLYAMGINGTTDGKPYEEQRKFPQGYRLITPEDKPQPGCMYWDTLANGWVKRTNTTEKFFRGNTYIVPIDPQPDIGEGYRVATPNDIHRQDMEYWDIRKQSWVPRPMPGLTLSNSDCYRVPIKPQPEIHEGYRVATKVDSERLDRQFWNVNYGKWTTATPGCNEAGWHYRVPVDRIPTDDDEVRRERPTVMVRDDESNDWKKATLLMIADKEFAYRFVGLMGQKPSCWRYCRFPYPGE